MDFLMEKKKDILIIILIVIILGLGGLIFISLNKKDEKCVDEVVVEKKEEVSIEEDNEEIEVIEYYVDIKGAVKKPGVYKVVKGSIVNDVIGLAGGLKSNANTKYINLSYEVNNHDVINIYTNNEVKNSSIKMECSCPSLDISSCDNSSIVTNNGTINNNGSSVNDKVNINSASKEELMSISGIGESKALAIIEYRNSNKFNSIEDIKNVSGIGDSLYNTIKDSITV
ncbi:MAG: helix-hairpin-helix domain-containing protein [Candidatus Coprovivens sp.]